MAGSLVFDERGRPVQNPVRQQVAGALREARALCLDDMFLSNRARNWIRDDAAAMLREQQIDPPWEEYE